MKPSKPGRFFDENGTVVILGAVLARGGEAIIHEVKGDSSRVGKIYHSSQQERLEKIRCMLAAAPTGPHCGESGQASFCWPERLLFNASGEYAGFLMPRLDLNRHHPVGLYWNSEDRATVAPSFTWKYLVVAAGNIASLLELLHSQGHVCGDLNEENLLVTDRALASLVDCDSMQIRDASTGTLFRSPVAREAYISPERIGHTLAECDRSVEDDYWALAILIYEMLMEGQHPTDGVGSPEERRERIRLGRFPFLGEDGMTPPTYALPVELLPEPIRAMFAQCFRAGHCDPAARPTAAAWKSALTTLTSSLVTCAVQPLHDYPAHHAACPWCELAAKWGVDRFAYVAGGQVALPSSRLGVAASSLAPARAAGSKFAVIVPRRWRIWGAAAAAAIVIASPALWKRTSPLVPAPPPHVDPLERKHIDPVIVPPPPKVPPASVGPTGPAPQAKSPVRPQRWGTGSASGSGTVVAGALPPPTAPKPDPPPGTANQIEDRTVLTTGPTPIAPPPVVAVVVHPPTSPEDTAPSPPPGFFRDLPRNFQNELTAAPPPVLRRGTLVWSGVLTRNVPIAIGDDSAGALRGDPFPGGPVIIESIQPAGVAVTEPPGPSNHYRRLVVRSAFSRNQVVTISWRTP